MDEEKYEFYNQLQDTISSCNRHDMIPVMGDLNAKIGNNNTYRKGVMGKFGVRAYLRKELLQELMKRNIFFSILLKKTKLAVRSIEISEKL